MHPLLREPCNHAIVKDVQLAGNTSRKIVIHASRVRSSMSKHVTTIRYIARAGSCNRAVHLSLKRGVNVARATVRAWQREKSEGLVEQRTSESHGHFSSDRKRISPFWSAHCSNSVELYYKFTIGRGEKFTRNLSGVSKKIILNVPPHIFGRESSDGVCFTFEIGDIRSLANFLLPGTRGSIFFLACCVAWAWAFGSDRCSRQAKEKCHRVTRSMG